MTINHENSIPRKHEKFSVHILPSSVNRQPIEIVDRTFVIKAEGINVNEDVHDHAHDDINGTYRAPNNLPYFHLHSCQQETSLFDPQPNIPARLYFSPTILHEATDISKHDDDNEYDTSPVHQTNEDSIHRERTSKIKMLFSLYFERLIYVLICVDRRKMQNNKHRFGQTFLLDTFKKDQLGTNQFDHLRPAIPDDDYILLVTDTNPKSSLLKRGLGKT
jgi:hypothetical protein